MSFSRELDDLSREQLYDVINGLKEEVSCLKTDLIAYKFVSNSYQKYFEFFIQNENIASNEEVLHLIKDIKLFNSLTEKKSFVALKRLNDNYLNKNRVELLNEILANSFKLKTCQGQEINPNQIERQKQNNERNDILEETPERKPIIDENEDFGEENNSIISETMIEKKPNIEEMENISINLTNNSEINVNSEKNISDIEFNSRTGHQLNQTLNQTIVKTETQIIDNSEEVSNESQTTIEAIEECKQELEESIECIDITENDSDLEQVIDERNEEFMDLTETHRTTADRMITQTTEDIFICEICSASLKTQNSLKMHKNRHTDKYPCKVAGCLYKGVKLSHLKGHMKAVHRITHPITQIHKYSRIRYKCEVCSAIFKTRKTLLNHKNKHTNKHLCGWDGCQFRALYFHDLKRHRTRVHPKVFKCNVKGCEKICQTSRGMEYHRNTHSDKYLCGINGCQKRVGSQRHLDQHKQIFHSNAKPYKCVVNGCDKRFKTRCNLRAHKIRAHQVCEQSSYEPPVKSLDCLLKYCEKRFSTRNFLRNHMIRVHKLTSNLVDIYFKKYDKSSAFKESKTLDNNNNKTTIPSKNQRANDPNKDIVEQSDRINSGGEENRICRKRGRPRKHWPNSCTEIQKTLESTQTERQKQNKESDKEIEVIELDDEYEEKPLIKSQLKVNKNIENISNKTIRIKEENVEESDEERAKKMMDSNAFNRMNAKQIIDKLSEVKTEN